MMLSAAPNWFPKCTFILLANTAARCILINFLFVLLSFVCSSVRLECKNDIKITPACFAFRTKIAFPIVQLFEWEISASHYIVNRATADNNRHDDINHDDDDDDDFYLNILKYSFISLALEYLMWKFTFQNLWNTFFPRSCSILSFRSWSVSAVAIF